ncbi:MAG: AAA family ATPase [Candidatus Helarchaeota archaeon]
MIIKSVHVQNYRCIYDEMLPCDQLTALIGPNGSGKSSFLNALDLFYTSNANYVEDDFYNKDTSQNIIITVTFSQLTKEEQKLFQSHMDGNELTVEKILKWPPTKANQKYYGTSLQNPEFDSFRSASGAGLRREYNNLSKNYSEFPSYTNKDNAEQTLQEWEQTHPNQCIRRRDSGQFFGFKEVGNAHLERYTRFILVPAVRDASQDAREGKNSPITEIMDIVIRSVLQQKKEIIDLTNNTQRLYEEIVDRAKSDELQKLEAQLCKALQVFIPYSKVQLDWLNDEIDIPMPRADIKLIEDDYPSLVQHTGHGLQRAFIMTLLQYLAVLQPFKNEREDSPIKKPNLIIGIEEPELYQHPNRQRHLAKILFKLATGNIKSISEFTQIIYSTHSPLFIDIKWFDKIRVFHKIQVERDKPKRTKVIFTNFDEIAKIIERADGKPKGTYTGATLEPRLKTLMTPWMNEGFFADVAVLVEGEEDRAAIFGIASALGHDLESMGISVIPCMGKNNLDRPSAIFSKLEIPIYVIWDSDFGKDNVKPEDNHRLLRLFNHPIEDWPKRITKNFACFEQDLNTTLRSEIDEVFFEDNLKKICNELCMNKKRHAFKNPQIIQELIKIAINEGKSSPTLEEIVSHIIAKKQSNTEFEDELKNEMPAESSFNSSQGGNTKNSADKKEIVKKKQKFKKINDFLSL